MNPGKRIKQLREDLGITQEEFALKIRRDRSTIAKIEAGGIELSAAIRQIICSEFNINEAWILTGEGLMKKEGPSPGIKEPVQPDFPADDFVLIRQMNGRISAGCGLVPDNTSEVAAAFRKDYMKRIGGKPDRMSLIKVAGDSMEPTFLSGDLVLVDHGRNIVPGRGGIYAMAIDDEIMIKRVQPISSDKLLVISDNKQYPPFEISRDQVQINGKVIWFARELER